MEGYPAFILAPKFQYFCFVSLLSLSFSYFLHGFQKLLGLIAILKHRMCFFPSHSICCFCFSIDDSFIRPVTFWIVGDFDSPPGRQLLYDAIKHQASIYDFILYLCLRLQLSSWAYVC